jgi:hypothetical protein
VAAVGAVIAVGLQLWGLYRVSSPPTFIWFANADKVEHAGGFALAVGMILLTVWLRSQSMGRALPRTALVVVAAIFAAHAVVSELIQHTFYRTRTGDPRDVLADGVGVAVGVGAFQLARRWSDGRAES